MSKGYLSTSRGVEIWQEMIWCRREYRADDSQFFKMSDFWRWMAEDTAQVSIRTYRSDSDDFRPKAAVLALGERVMLSVDEKLIANADRGCGLSNLILAHEATHFALGHHVNRRSLKHFELKETAKGMAIRPPNLEEREADYGAVFLQCGTALLDPGRKSVELARRAFTDVRLVEKARQLVRVPAFQCELAFRLEKPPAPRFVF